jgi:hypothetical protein
MLFSRVIERLWQGVWGKPVKARRCPATVILACDQESQNTHLCQFSTTFAVEGVGTGPGMPGAEIRSPCYGRQGVFVYNAPCGRFFVSHPGEAGMRVLLAMAIWLVCASVVPGRAAGAEEDARKAAIAWLHSQQLADGGFGEMPANKDARSNASATSDAVYTLARLGENPAGKEWTVNGHSAMDALAVTAPSYARLDAGQAGKIARAVAMAGGNPRSFAGMDLITMIEKAYDPATGRYNANLQFRHTLAVEALALAQEPIPPMAVDDLLASRHPDGSWFWAFDGTAGDVDSTGRIAQVLAAYGGVRCAPFFVPTFEYLQGQQSAAGLGAGSPPGPPNANSTALAVAGLRAAGYDVDKIHDAGGGPSLLQSLLAFQRPDGGFVYMQQPGHEESRLVATLDALDGLSQQGPAGRACSPVYLPVHLIGPGS